MTREEAIEVYNGLLNQKIKEAFEFFAPELAESEDERIRKELKEAFEAYDIESTWNGIPIRSIFAWLEKQKESSITANDLDEEIHRFFDDCIDVHEVKLYGNISERVIPVDCYELTARHFAKWGEEKKEQKQEWSEEDWKLLDEVREHIIGVTGDKPDLTPNKIYDGFLDLIDRLKFAKPQLKQEWSKEDEEMIGCIIDDIREAKRNSDKEYFKELCDKEIAWLKSLRPSWKPSEEHLSALLAVFNDPDNIGSQTCQLALTDLYEQLKKL